jgi:hypothetical protein
MNSHNIPQHVTGYQGRILGSLTAKQFIYIALGAITIFVLLTAAPLTTITIIIVSLVGFFTFVFALAKIDDRPLDAWVLQVLLALQSTPQYIWRKEGDIPEILIPGHKPQIPTSQKTRSEQRQKKMNDFLKFWRTEREISLTKFEQERLEKLNRLQSQLQESVSSSSNDLTAQKTTAPNDQ